MPIVSREITDLTGHGERFRMRCQYVFDDDRVVDRYAGHVNSPAEADQLLIDLEPQVLAAEQARDSEEAERNDRDITARGQASLRQIARQYLRRAMEEPDPFISLKKLQRVNTFFTAQGWSQAQIKSRLDLTDTQWSKMVSKFIYLTSKEQILIDHQAVLRGE